MDWNVFFQKPILAFVVFIFGFIIGRLLGQLTNRILKDMNADKFFKKIGLKISVEKYLGKIIRNIIYITSVILALNILGVTKIILLIIGSIGFILVSLQLILNFRDFFPNLIAGYHIRSEKTKWAGKTIKTNIIRGKVVRVGVFETHIISEGENIYLPNRSLRSDVVIK